MVVTHFDTYRNGIEPTQQPNPNPQESPTFGPVQMTAPYGFFRVCFEPKSEPGSEEMMPEYLELEVQLTYPPGRHFGSSYEAQQLCLLLFNPTSTQVPVYDPLTKVVHSPQRGVAKTHVLKGREKLCCPL